jgi:hypothetical protein
MNLTKAIANVCALIVLFIVVTGCTVILPESQNANYNATKQVGSSENVTVSVQALGEQQRFRLSQLVSYSAKQGYKLAVYEVNITNLGGPRQAGNTTFFTLAASDGTIYQAVLSTLAPRVITQGETVSGTVIFEILQSAMPQSLRYDDGNSKVTVSVPSTST